jgi:hypothetical protein
MRTLSLGAIGGDREVARRRRGAVRGRRVACGGRHWGSSKASGASTRGVEAAPSRRFEPRANAAVLVAPPLAA